MIAVRKVDIYSKTDRALIRALLYFDIFDYPLSRHEIFQFAPISCIDGSSSLDELVAAGIIFRLGDFYSVRNDLRLVSRRINGNLLAQKRMETAHRFSKIISTFPYVRAVLLSGSISKGFMEKGSDIDFFIITETNRLWIVRTALALFRRIFLFNSHKNLCTNYFIDIHNLEIPDRNIFAATELVTLKPMYGKKIIEKFFGANHWVHSFLPQSNFTSLTQADANLPFKNSSEKILSLLSLDKLNRWLMKKTLAYWQGKYFKGTDLADFEIAFRTKEGVSKSHPRFFQKRVLSHFGEKIRSFEFKNGMDLSL